jgi:hypothetical protein
LPGDLAGILQFVVILAFCHPGESRDPFCFCCFALRADREDQNGFRLSPE